MTSRITIPNITGPFLQDKMLPPEWVYFFEQLAASANRIVEEQQDVFLPEPVDGTVTISQTSAKRRKIIAIATQCEVGTCTATFNINGVALGGPPNSVSTTEDVQVHSTANVLEAGDKLTATISISAGCEKMSASIIFSPA